MKKQDQQHAVEAKPDHEHLKTEISKQVFQNLGQPGDLQTVQIRHLWTDHFRVNVLVGTDAASAKVGHSYFIMVGNDGNIISSTPKMTRMY